LKKELTENPYGLIDYYINNAPVTNAFKDEFKSFCDSCLLNINVNSETFLNFGLSYDCDGVNNEYDLIAQNITKISDNTAYSTLVDAAVGVGTCGLGAIGVILSSAASLVASGKSTFFGRIKERIPL
jgi:hypothetical protein